jgi:hypothetical protein
MMRHEQTCPLRARKFSTLRPVTFRHFLPDSGGDEKVRIGFGGIRPGEESQRQERQLEVKDRKGNRGGQRVQNGFLIQHVCQMDKKAISKQCHFDGRAALQRKIVIQEMGGGGGETKDSNGCSLKPIRVCAIWMIRGAGLWIYAGPGA